MTLINHRGINITRAEVPAAPYRWIHDAGNGSGSAETIGEAIRQINAYLGSPDPTTAPETPVKLARDHD